MIDSCDTEASDQVEICQNEGYVDDGLALSTWNFEGHATWDSTNEWVELTDTGTNRAGTAFQTSATVDSDNVVIEFSFFVSGGSGADGISLTALDSTRMTGFVGGSGGGIGYAGLPGWSIEVDTWYNSENNDPTRTIWCSHDGNQGSYAAWAALPEMEDGNWRYGRHRQRISHDRRSRRGSLHRPEHQWTRSVSRLCWLYRRNRISHQLAFD